MRFLKFLWQKWLIVARPIGNFQAQLILSLFYFIILAPVAIFLKFFADPLNLKPKQRSSNFEKWEHPKEDLEQARKQY